MNYLAAVPGIRQVIDDEIYTIKRMYSRKVDAVRCVILYRESKVWESARLYIRKKSGKNFGKHPYCVAVRGRKS
jgi:hypothetical protein